MLGYSFAQWNFVCSRSHGTRYLLREEENGRFSFERGALQGIYQAYTTDLEALEKAETVSDIKQAAD